MKYIPFKSENHIFELTVPVIIVGAGACGLVAALYAKKNSCEVLIIEKDPFPRGSTSMSSGFIPACGTKIQKQLNIDDTPEIMCNDIENKNKYKSDHEITKKICETSGKIIDWLMDTYDIPFQLVDGFLYPGHSKLRMHTTPEKTGEELMSYLLNATEKEGIDLLTSTEVINVYIDNNNNVKGVDFKYPDGNIESVGCNALILACNGFGGNPDLISKFIPEMKNAIYFGHESNVGNAIILGEQINASIKDISSFQAHASLVLSHQALLSWATIMQGGIQINKYGHRFSNEEQGYSEQASLVLEQPDKISWIIYDEKIHNYLLQQSDYKEIFKSGGVNVYPNLHKIANSLKIDEKNLISTFNEIELSSEQHQPDQFGRIFNKSNKLTAPYYVVKVTGALFHTQGGLEVNCNAQVKHIDGSIFNNLYAGGGAARGISGDSSYGYLSGNGLLTAIVLGAIAGEHSSKNSINANQAIPTK